MTKESKILTGVIAAIVVVMIGGFVAANKPDKAAPPVTDAGKMIRSDSNRKGSSDKAVLVEFGDFQCPSCGAVEPTIERLLSEYGDKISFVFRNFPLQQHANAQAAAEAAEAAGAQGKYWEMHDKIYATQADWQGLGSPNDKFAELARGLGLDGDKVKSAIEQSSYTAKITTDIADGTALKVSGTPTFFLGDKLLASNTYDDLKKAIDEALAK